MTTDYNAIAEQYRRAKGQSWRTAIEAYTLTGLLGNLTGLNVVDLACGEGFYTRRLQALGVRRVLGVDLSEGMIDLARKEEARAPLGIDYIVGDGRDLQLAPEFDVAVAAYLLNYARTADELLAMCQGVARCLKPGGRFIAVNSSPSLGGLPLPSYRKYGFETDITGPMAEGTPFIWTFHLEDGPVSVENYHLSRRTHDFALEAAGFRSIRWVGPRVSPYADPPPGDPYWSDFLEYPPVAFLECVK